MSRSTTAAGVSGSLSTNGVPASPASGERPGQPEFVTLSVDGDTLLGVTTEEDEVWLIAVDRIGERQEEAAKAATQETPQERAAAWASLFQGPGPSERLRELWAHGLARNPATPDDLRAGLLGLSHFLLWRRLPTAVVEAAMVHPEWKLRQLLAEAQPNITAEQWARLILGEQDARHRWILAMLAADRRAELTDTAYEQLAADPSVRVREETARLPGLPVRLLTALAADVDPSVRASACRRAWAHLGNPARLELLGDPYGKVRVEALLQYHQEHPMPRSVFDSEELKDRAVETCRLERGLAEHLARHGDPARRRSLAGNPRPPTCCWRCGSGGPAASAPPTAPTAIRTSPAAACSATPTTRIHGCANWPWTTRSRLPRWSSGSAGTPTKKYDTGPQPTHG